MNTKTILRGTVKHEQVRDGLREQIRRMAPGDRLLPVRELMRTFRVSQSTMDRALRELEDGNLITRRLGSGIYVQGRSARKKTKMIGVVVSDITDRFCSLLVRGVEQQLSASGYRMVLCHGYEELQRDLNVIHSLQESMDGLLIHPLTANVHNPLYVRYFADLERKKECPFLLVDIAIPGVGANYVGFDNYGAFRSAAKTFSANAGAGCGLVYIGSFESVVGMERLAGFKAGLREAGVPDHRVTTVNVPLAEPLSLPPNFRRKGLPVVFFVASPLLLTRLISDLGERGMNIPGDAVILSVVEEDYRDYVHAPVIALVKESVQLGRDSARILQDMVGGKTVSKETRYDLRLEVPDALKSFMKA